MLNKCEKDSLTAIETRGSIRFPSVSELVLCYPNLYVERAVTGTCIPAKTTHHHR